ncbi:MAG TPA: hypothetical protein VIM60_03745 [Edaphobacter sp.]
MASPKPNSSIRGAKVESASPRVQMPDDPVAARSWIKERLVEGKDERGDVAMSDEEWTRLHDEALSRRRRRAS